MLCAADVTGCSNILDCLVTFVESFAKNRKQVAAFQAWVYLEDAVDIAKRVKYYQLRSDAMKGTNPCHLSLCFVPNSQLIKRF